MTTDFEHWIQSNKGRLCEEAIGLFMDSVKCLKNDIDRPAYLLAYQGMMVTLREVLRGGRAPKGYTDGEWTNCIAKLAKEDSWDAAVFDLVKKGPTTNGNTIIKESPLHMRDSVRSQFDYWRNHRNICAHYKKEPFIKAHVLTLYAFIAAHLMHISVTGGLELMLDKLRKYCDPTKTPDNEDIIPLFDEITTRVQAADMEIFLKNAAKIIIHSPRKDYVAFINTILKQDSDKYDALKQSAKSLILNSKSLELRLVEQNPEYVLQFCTTKEQIYEFLHDDIYQLRTNRLSVIAQLLIAGKIEDSAKDALFASIQADLYKLNRWVSFKDEAVLNVLTSNGYFDVFVRDYLGSEMINNISKMREICYSTDFYISHMHAMPINESVVTQLIKVLGPEKNCPYTLADRFMNELIKDEAFYGKIKSIADEHNITLPDNWKTK